MPTDPVAAKLIFNVEELCRRSVRGKMAAQNWSVRWHLALRIASILLSSLRSVGVIVEKASANLPGETGGAFWGSVILLVFGILSQFANEFQVAQRAADSRSLAEKCEVYDTRLENVLTDDDPRTDVASMLVEVNTLFESERYNKQRPGKRLRGQDRRKFGARFCHSSWGGRTSGREPLSTSLASYRVVDNKVLPQMIPQMEQDAAARAAHLIGRNQGHWQLALRKQKGVM